MVESQKSPIFPNLDLDKELPDEQSSMFHFLKGLEKLDQNPKTNLPGEMALKRFISNYDQRHPYNLIASYIDLRDFGEINRAIGHEATDEKLKTFGNFLKNNLRGEDDHLFHLHGDEFVLLSIPTKENNTQIDQLTSNDLNNSKNGLDKHLEEVNQKSEIKFDFRSTIFDPKKHTSLSDAINESDHKLMDFKEKKRQK